MFIGIKVINSNFGIDTRFLNGRLSFGLDAYLDKNTEMLVQRDGLVPVTIGGALAAENYDAIDALWRGTFLLDGEIE